MLPFVSVLVKSFCPVILPTCKVKSKALDSSPSFPETVFDTLRFPDVPSWKFVTLILLLSVPIFPSILVTTLPETLVTLTIYSLLDTVYPDGASFSINIYSPTGSPRRTTFP